MSVRKDKKSGYLSHLCSLSCSVAVTQTSNTGLERQTDAFDRSILSEKCDNDGMILWHIGEYSVRLPGGMLLKVTGGGQQRGAHRVRDMKAMSPAKDLHARRLTRKG